MALTSSHSEVKSTQPRHPLPRSGPGEGRRGHSARSSGRRRAARVVAHPSSHPGRGSEGAQGDGGVGHRVEAVVDGGTGDERDGAALGRAELAGRIVDLGCDVDEDGTAAQIRVLRSQADRRGPAERHADDALGGGRHRFHERGHRLGVLPGSVVAVGPPVRVPVARQVDGDRRTAESQHDGVPGVPVLGPAVQEDELGLALTPLQIRERLPGGEGEGMPRNDRLPREGDVPLGRVLVSSPNSS